MVWNRNFFNNSTRTFLFKLHNNILGYNAAVSHFVRGHSSNCTFCTLSGNPEPNRETALHLFYGCRSTERVLNETFSSFLGANTVLTRQELFVKFTKPEKPKNDTLFLIAKLFLKYIWDCKVRNGLPNTRGCIKSIRYELEIIKKISTEIRELVTLSRLNVNNEH